MKWTAYPEHDSNAPPDAFDRSFYRKRLLDDADRLFTKGESEVTLVYVARKPHTVNTQTATDLASLEQALMPFAPVHGQGQQLSDVFVSIKQRHSWDHLQISLKLTQRLLTFFDVSPLFLDYLHCFGYRLDDVGDQYVSYRSVDSVCGDGSLRTESCYNLRFPERNGRPTGNPWSMRQSALYIQHNAQKDLAIWILLQPSKSVEHQITNLVFSPDFRNTHIHSALFNSTGRFWKDYIDDLQKELLPMEHKAFYSKVGVACHHDFSLAFKDYQLLQQLNQELVQVEYIVHGSIETARDCEADNAPTGQGSVRVNTTAACSAVSMLSGYTAQMQGQYRAVARLLRTSDRISQTVKRFLSPSPHSEADQFSQLSQILTYRNGEASQRIDGAIAEQAMALHDLARAAARDSEALAALGRLAHRDSRTVKVLTAVAALYLPAALVAGVFSSNLVQTDSSGQTAGHFHLAPQFWLFPTTTVLLAVLTLGPVLLWQRFKNDEVVVVVNGAP